MKQNKIKIKMVEKIEKVALKDIKPYAQNAKKHPEEQIDKIAAQITMVGFLIPILLDDNNEIVAGEGRYRAAKKLDMTIVPCVRSRNLTPEQIRAFRIADNKVAEGELDEEILTSEMIELFEADFDLGMTGFSDKELKELLSDFDHETRGKEKLAQRRKGAKGKILKLKKEYEYQIIVECKGEAQQTKLIERFKGEGLKCRPLIL